MSLRLKTKQSHLQYLEGDASAESVEQIFSSKGELIACILPHNYKPNKTVFITSDYLNQQLGFIVYPENGVIKRHKHRPIKRKISGTQEILLVRSGQVEVYLFSELKEFVAKRVLSKGDVIMLIKGGHGFRMLKDTVLMEIKQGPYLGVEEKEYF